MHIRARFALLRHAVNGANRCPVNDDNAFIAFNDIFEERLRDNGLAAGFEKHLKQRAIIRIPLFDEKHPCPAITKKRL